MRKYYSNYTGRQIDEAVSTIIENQIGLEDLSPELVATIKSWCLGEGEGVQELVFRNRYEFPILGQPNMLYIATDEDAIYYWKENRYVAIANSEWNNINLIHGGGAQENGK